ncbi:MAG: carboxypeptidase regulatory-like domain-containing protein, partial [Terriglobales bacterium]
MRIVALTLCFALAASLPALGQTAGTASLSGTVVDATGAVVPGAEVKATLPATGVVRSTKAGDNGKYLLPQLPPGRYKVEFRKDGFKTAVHENLEVLVGVTTTLDARLEVGAAAQVVTVEATAIALNTTDASLGTPLSGIEVKALPSLDLNPAGLLSLQAGVAYIPSESDNAGGYGGTSDLDGRSGAVNGARSDQSNITLDGVDCNDPTKGYAFTCVLRSTQASLQEFRTTTTNYGAEAGGRSSGGQVQLVTKGGTNSLHGEAYYAHRNEAFNANDFFLNKSGIEEPKFRRHIYGAALGGPIWKNRFYLFGNVERLKQDVFENKLRDVPAMHFRDGVFIYPCVDDPAFADCPDAATSVTGLSGTVYPVDPGFRGLSPAESAALDPLGIGPNLALVDYWRQYPEPTPGETGTFDGINVVGHRFGAAVSQNYVTYIARADFNIDTAGKHILFWRGTMVDDVIQVAPQFAGQPSQGILANHKGFVVGYTAVLSDRVVNNLRWGLTRVSDGTTGLQTQEYVDIRFIDELQDVFSDTFGRIVPQHHLRDDLNWVKGKHSLSMGGELRYTRNQKSNNGTSFHFFTVNPSWLQDGGGSVTPGDSFCDRPVCATFPLNDGNFEPFVLQLGVITEADANYNFNRDGSVLGTGDAVLRKFAVNEYEFYIQDQWRATPS